MDLKNGAKIAIALIWLLCSFFIRFAARLAGRGEGRLVVLCYHGVPHNARARFARQMDAVTRGAKVIRAGHAEPLPAGTNHVAITFDDALQSVVDDALPELLERSLVCTIFVPVSELGRPPGWEMAWDAPERMETVMAASGLRSLPDLVELGSHSLTHAHLTRLDDASLADETFKSRRELAALVGKPITTFAFPYGEHDARVVEACGAAGYDRAFTITPEASNTRDNGFLRGRTLVDPLDGSLDFYLKMRGAYSWMRHASALKRAFARWRGQP